MRVTMLLLALLFTDAVHAADDSTLKNWFDDLFFQIADGVPNRPQPLGPLLTGTEDKPPYRRLPPGR